MRTFIAALLVIARNWKKLKCPSVGEKTMDKQIVVWSHNEILTQQ